MQYAKTDEMERVGRLCTSTVPGVVYVAGDWNVGFFFF